MDSLTRWQHRISLRGRLLALLAITMLPLVGLVLWSTAQQRESARATASAEAFRIATTASAGQEDWLDTSRQMLTALAQLLPVGPGDAQICSAVLETLH